MVVVVVDEMGHWEISGRVLLRPAPPVCLPLSLCFGPQGVLVINSHNVAFGPLLPFPPFPSFLGRGTWALTLRTALFFVTDLSYRTARFAGEAGGEEGREGKGREGKGETQPRRRARGKAVPDR